MVLRPRRRFRDFLDLAASAAMMAASVAVLWFVLGRQPSDTQRFAGAIERPLPNEPVSLAGLRLAGNVDAAVAVIEYSDFQCSFCGRFAVETWPELRKRYVDTGQVLAAFSHFPIDELHPEANRAAEIAECAGEQGKFWETHDWLFARQASLRDEVGDAGLVALTAAIGLEEQDFRGCLLSLGGPRIVDHKNNARSLGVQGTPTFFLGRMKGRETVQVTTRLDGAVSFGRFEAALDKILADVTKQD